MGTLINSHFLALTVFITVGYQFISAITVLHKFDKDNDHAGITNFVILAISALVLKGSKNFRQLVLPLLVLVWGLRLGLFLVIRIMQWGQDRRFDGRRGSLCRLVIIAMLQVIWVWTLSLPVTFVIASDRHPSLQAKDIIGWTLWSVGFLIEAIADQQKLAFKFPPENRDRWCSTGLWRYSRHPNYFGEILLWWGVFVASSPLLEGGTWIVIVGPILHTMLILFASGMPWLEESANTRYGHINPYRAYRDATSPLIPLPPVVYLYLPRWFKIAFLFELPLYSVTLPSLQARKSHPSSH
ncbi:uncharacterized protein LOC127794187 [Diospyros lotus]|uniref:uncharacterized protein LOC127794187 n=1 Tax=Diospyros lotus TaxID=55363 RepID=UPI00225B525A|nr:uncharacterized protein LOC127794187 [Diospyros lotus]